MRGLKRQLISLAALLVFQPMSARAQNQQASQPPVQKADLSSMKIEDLMNIKVTSASKKVESLSQAPAAIFVITGEDIRRGGFTSVPDALRIVPGLYVVQLNAHVWIVAARGFSNTFNDKMLVLIDGRLVYSPTYGGVYWDVQDPLLDDIDRIEVIRGPGGTLWGANAVNGVINIIMKNALKTQGMEVSTSAGVNEGYAARVRYGGKAGDNFAYRLYGTSNYWLPTVNANGADNYDTWTISQGGMRFDWDLSQKDTLSFEGQGYSGRVRDVTAVFSPSSPVAVEVNSNGVVKGGHVLARWKHAFSDRSNSDVLGYCDWTIRGALGSAESRNTCDLEFQHAYSFAGRQSLTWGGSILTTGDTWDNTFSLSIVPPYRRDTTYSAFAQYDIEVVPDKLRIIAGSKFEHNDYTGFEYQPQARFVWTPNKKNTFWAAFSRAVRTPSRVEAGLRYRLAQINPAPPPETFLVYSGEPSVKSEVLHATELGYRYQWNEKFSADATIYYNDYDDLAGLSAPGTGIVNPSPFYIDVPVNVINVKGGQTHGLELSAKYAPFRRWTLSTEITELRGNSSPGAGFPAVAANPLHQVNVQSRIDLSKDVNLDATYYYNDAISHALPVVNRIDAGVSTKPFRGLTLSLWGRNLQQDRHQEAIPEASLAGEIRRSVSFTLRWESNPDRGKSGQ